MARVTVIVPNYNHARFLRTRMESILTQSYTDWEAILLDDASTDDSRAILDEYRTHPQVRQVVYNLQNSGSAFQQWNRGLALAVGEFVWIAESDDYADPRFLERLVAQMDEHPSAGIAYCQSYRVNEAGELHGTNLAYTDVWDSERWRNDFVAQGIDECRTTMFQFNIIPNASATLLRRSVIEAVGGAKETMRLCGDYLLYVEMLLRSDLAYIAEPLNYYRFHGRSVRSSTYFNGTFVAEVYRIQERILQEVAVSDDLRERIFDAQVRHWSQAIYGKASLDMHRKIYHAARRADPHIGRRWGRFVLQAVWNRLTGRAGK